MKFRDGDVEKWYLASILLFLGITAMAVIFGHEVAQHALVRQAVRAILGE